MEITSKLQYTHVYIYIYTYMLKLLLAIRVYCQGAQDFQWPYLNPFALVSYLCVACVHYAGLLKYHLANDTDQWGRSETRESSTAWGGSRGVRILLDIQ
jgi:hypothetical protein